MILIADSGATKTDWALVENGHSTQMFQTKGLSPVHLSEEQLLNILRQELLPQLHAYQHISIKKVFFYGAGCRGAGAERMHKVLLACFADADVVVESDLLGAARAVCGHEEGLVCILGTGSNSALYDGEKIIKNIPPLGYILGDEGSGAVLGRMFLNLIFKDEAAEHLRARFLQSSGLTYDQIIDRVYRQSNAGRFLASLVPFVKDNLNEDCLLELTRTNFRNFLNNNLLRYNSLFNRVYAVGGMADAFQEQLKEVCEEVGFCLVKVDRKPIFGLVDFHA